MSSLHVWDPELGHPSHVTPPRDLHGHCDVTPHQWGPLGCPIICIHMALRNYLTAADKVM